MIHFDFTVSDADAENIISILRNQISRNNHELLFHLDKPDEKHWVERYKRDNEYVEGLIKKMTNTRVEEPEISAADKILQTVRKRG